ncbi:MAG: HlyD family type I secretion periplasmic adaptor subunit [Alphaproteobacteria bacterium]
MSNAPSRYGQSIRRNLIGGAVLALALVLVIGGWATTAEISGAVIAGGNLVAVSAVKKVQHPSGGVVSLIAVKNGDRVEQGDLLVRLDATQTRANLSIVTKRLDELYARRGRLLAERDGLKAPVFSPELKKRGRNSEVASLMKSERRFFTIRATARAGYVSRLKERIKQLNEEVKGYADRAEAKAKEIVLIKRELKAMRDLWEKNLTPLTKLTQLEREAVRLGGERAQLLAAIASSKGRIEETELQILQIGRDFTAEVAKELRATDAKLGELIERKVAAEDKLRRIDLCAPTSGIVHELAVHTVGGVIKPGDVVTRIVPVDDTLAIDAKVRPSDIDQLALGAEVTVRFTAFNQRTTPVIGGRLERISADITTDPRTGASYYTARISIDAKSRAKLGNLKLVPGMPAEVFIKTSERKVIALLLKPLSDQFTKAFRED